MKRSLLLILFLSSYFYLNAQEAQKLEYKLVEFKSLVDEFLTDKFLWESGEYGFLGISAYSKQKKHLRLSIRFKQEGTWGEWQLMHEDHNAEEIEDRQAFVIDPIFVKIEAWQVRSDQSPDEEIVLRFFIAPKTQSEPPKNLNHKTNSTCNCPRPPICDRSCWCPSGNCPPPGAYVPNVPTHLIVHHSAGFSNYNDYNYVVAYYWDLHVNTNGWSDIGYNWLIDPNGVVYEGRGSGVIGAHFSCLNTGTTGLCLIGNYDNFSVPNPGLQSLAELLLYESCLNGINPGDSSLHQSSQLTLRHVSGHRDANSATVGCPSGTACPGHNLYTKLDSLGLSLSQNACLLGAEELAINETKFYPNPTNSIIQWEGHIEALRLFNSEGREISINTPSSKSLDLGHLSPGVYQLYYLQDDLWQVQKIILQ